MTRTIKFFSLGLLIISVACQRQTKKEDRNSQSTLELRYQRMLDYPVDSTAIPRVVNLSTGEFKSVNSRDWISGFYAGSLWELYLLTEDSSYLKKAKQWTAF